MQDEVRNPPSAGGTSKLPIAELGGQAIQPGLTAASATPSAEPRVRSSGSEVVSGALQAIRDQHTQSHLLMTKVVKHENFALWIAVASSIAAVVAALMNVRTYSLQRDQILQTDIQSRAIRDDQREQMKIMSDQLLAMVAATASQQISAQTIAANSALDAVGNSLTIADETIRVLGHLAISGDNSNPYQLLNSWQSASRCISTLRQAAAIIAVAQPGASMCDTKFDALEDRLEKLISPTLTEKASDASAAIVRGVARGMIAELFAIRQAAIELHKDIVAWSNDRK